MLVFAPVEDADEETSVLFALNEPPSHLGYVSLEPRLTLSVAGNHYTVLQRPEYTLAGKGVTGGIVWWSTPLVLDLLSKIQSQRIPCLPRSSDSLDGPLELDWTFSKETTILELGSGSAGLAALVLARDAKLFIATDHDAELLRQLAKHCCTSSTTSVAAARLHRSGDSDASLDPQRRDNINVLELNWEDDFATSVRPSVKSLLKEQARNSGLDEPLGIDLILCLDCIYSSYLLTHLISTVSNLLQAFPGSKALFGQQLRDDTVHLEFVEQLLAKGLRIYRLEDDDVEAAAKGPLADLNGYVVYLVDLP